MKHILLSSIFFAMMSCHINGSFHRTPLKTAVKLYALRNHSTTPKFTTEQVAYIESLLKASENRIMNDLKRVTKIAKTIDREVLKLSDVYDALGQEDINYLQCRSSWNKHE